MRTSSLILIIAAGFLIVGLGAGMVLSESAGSSGAGVGNVVAAGSMLVAVVLVVVGLLLRLRERRLTTSR